MGISSVNSFNRVDQSSYNTKNTVSPNWSQIPHKGMDALPKDEIRQRVKELGVEFANATTEQERGEIGKKVQDLFTQYTSYVSPDRKSLYEQAIKTIKQHGGSNNQPQKFNEPKTLIDYLNAHDGIGKGMSFDRAYPMSGGGTVSAAHVTGGGATFDVSYQGENVLSIHSGCIRGNGIYYTPTIAEQAMTQEIANVYYHARDSANSVPVTTQATGGGIDVRV